MPGRAAALFAVLLWPAAVCAQSPSADEQARTHFASGVAAFDTGRYEVALDEFHAAYELSHRPELLYNVGLCQDRLRQDREALASFEAFLAARPDTSHRAEVEPRITALRAALARHERDEQARAATASPVAPTPVVHHDDVAASPWLWLAVGVAVVGAVVLSVFFATQDPGVQAPIPGTDGTIMALRF